MAKRSDGVPVTEISERPGDVKTRIEDAVDKVTEKVADMMHPED